MLPRKKLIEVALPLEAINAASVREKSIRHGHPSTLHLWWARRPLCTARAVIWASLVDAPSSRPDLFPTEEEQAAERQRLFGIMEELVLWENSNNPEVLEKAKAEILKYNPEGVPELLDPFAGGGAIPLEAQRLGLKAHAHDLNPVAVMINKAMIEIPPRFANMPPVHEQARCSRLDNAWAGVAGFAEDVLYYGNRLKELAYERIGHLYPQISVPKEFGGGKATVIAWIWARTVKCPNPACGCQLPLVSNFMLSKKGGKEAWMSLSFKDGQPVFKVQYGGTPDLVETMHRKGATCPCCSQPVDFAYIRTEGQAGRMGTILAAIVAEGKNGRLYLDADEEHIKIAQVALPDLYPSAELSGKSRVNVTLYGLNETSDLFTPRQLTALTTFSDLLDDIEEEATKDALASALPNDGISLANGGKGATAYGQAVRVYLAFVVDKLTDYHSSVCSWNSSRQIIRNVYGRQAIAMAWDYAEGNFFCDSSGSYANMLEWIYKSVRNLPLSSQVCSARQQNAQADCGLRNIMISTDPPYYDNICYADLSDFFYVWMRQNLKKVYPELFRSMLTPKMEELIASPFLYKKDEAKLFFERGMLEACRQMCLYSRDDVPVTIYYAYKQSETENEKTASSGWETMLSAIIQAGFAITGTWPMRTEMPNRSIATGTNALASSIVLVCRKRAEDAPMTTQREFVNELRRELKPALDKMLSANIAPVDLAQSAIGPGMGVYSKYSQVLGNDGEAMSVRIALQIINQELDKYFNDQDGELDRASRFCIDLYTQYGFDWVKFGEADTLARAKNTSVESLETQGVLASEKGQVHLLERSELADEKNMEKGNVWLLMQHLVLALEIGGIERCASMVAKHRENAEVAKSLAYRIHTIAERKGWAKDAGSYNALIISWNDIQARSSTMKTRELQQANLDV